MNAMTVALPVYTEYDDEDVIPHQQKEKRMTRARQRQAWLDSELEELGELEGVRFEF